jgi:hypothetical protein
MADYSGIVAEPLIVDRTFAMKAALFNYTGDVSSIKALVPPSSSGTWDTGSATNPTGQSPAYADSTGVVRTETTPGHDWFNRVHLIPRKVFDFGLIASTVTDTFEIFSAWKTAISFTAFGNPVTGLTIPFLPTPIATVPPFTSFDAPTSARFNYVPLSITVSKDGTPLFDDYLTFSFATGETLSIRVLGTRVSVITAIYESEFEERWEFITDYIESTNGTEQVISLVNKPVQYFSVNYLLDSTDRQRFHNTLFGSQARMLGFPVWHEDVYTTAAISAGATSVAVEATTNVDFRVGGLAIIYESPTKYDVALISAISTNLLTFTTTPTRFAYTATKIRVAPVRLGYFINEPTGVRYPVTLEGFNATFRVWDNETGMFAQDTSTWNSYSGLVLLDDANLMSGSVQQQFGLRTWVIDNNTGSIEVSTDWGGNQLKSTKGFRVGNRADMMKLKKLLLALRGGQISFRIPTFIEDLTAVAQLTSASATIDISHINYTKYVQAKEPKKVFRITFTDGSSLIREIQSSIEVSDTVERLTLNANWPATYQVSSISRIEFLQLARFNTESFSFQYDRTGFARLSAPIKTLVPT